MMIILQPVKDTLFCFVCLAFLETMAAEICVNPFSHRLNNYPQLFPTDFSEVACGIIFQI